MTSEGRDDAFSILVVCTGNVCRSPLAERLLLGRLDDDGVDVTIRSAGTRALILEDMTPETSALVERFRGRGGGHRARQLTADLVAHADLVLTATRAHRSEVVSLHPRASRYTYTITQFARLLEALREDPSARSPRSDDANASLRVLVDDAAAMRGFVPPVHADDDDIEDPYRRSPEVYDRVAVAVANAVGEIGAAISAVARAA